MNRKYTALLIVAILVLSLWLYGRSRNSNDHIRTNPIALEDLKKVDPSYIEILAQRESPDKKIIVSFAIREEGNHNVSGDIVLTNQAIGKSNVIRTFNTSRFEFDQTLSFISNTEIKFTETIAFSDSTYSEETIFNLVDPSKNISLPPMPEHTPQNLSEYRTAYVWFTDHSVQFERRFSDSIGTSYPTETWQYNLATKKYKQIN